MPESRFCSLLPAATKGSLPLEATAARLLCSCTLCCKGRPRAFTWRREERFCFSLMSWSPEVAALKGECPLQKDPLTTLEEHGWPANMLPRASTGTQSIKVRRCCPDYLLRVPGRSKYMRSVVEQDTVGSHHVATARVANF